MKKQELKDFLEYLHDVFVNYSHGQIDASSVIHGKRIKTWLKEMKKVNFEFED